MFLIEATEFCIVFIDSINSIEVPSSRLWVGGRGGGGCTMRRNSNLSIDTDLFHKANFTIPQQSLSLVALYIEESQVVLYSQ